MDIGGFDVDIESGELSFYDAEDGETYEFYNTRQAAKRLGVTRQALSAMTIDRELQPFAKITGVTRSPVFLYSKIEVDKLAKRRAQEKEKHREFVAASRAPGAVPSSV